MPWQRRRGIATFTGTARDHGRGSLHEEAMRRAMRDELDFNPLAMCDGVESRARWIFETPVVF